MFMQCANTDNGNDVDMPTVHEYISWCNDAIEDKGDWCGHRQS
jgi:hypothetical protein